MLYHPIWLADWYAPLINESDWGILVVSRRNTDNHQQLAKINLVQFYPLSSRYLDLTVDQSACPVGTAFCPASTICLFHWKSKLVTVLPTNCSRISSELFRLSPKYGYYDLLNKLWVLSIVLDLTSMSNVGGCCSSISECSNLLTMINHCQS